MEKPTRLLIYQLGLGDGHVAEQYTTAFNVYCQEHNPDWGEVVMAAGTCGDVLHPHRGDINLYWWWSMGGRDDHLDFYVAHADVRPDIVLCLSLKMLEYAKNLGLRAIYMPGATGPEFFPLHLAREGTGYCGSGPGHKDKEQEQCMIDPARKYGFEWATRLPGGRPELNRFYNSKKVVIGMTETMLGNWGGVTVRTMDVLAGATPFVTHKHYGMDEMLGFHYPYVSSTPEETTHWLEELMHSDHTAEFAEYSRLVLASHTFAKRIEVLAAELDAFTNEH